MLMEVIKNPIRGTGLQIQRGICKGNIKDEPSSVINLLQYCPISKETPLIFLAVASAVAVSALPVTSPVNPSSAVIAPARKAA